MTISYNDPLFLCLINILEVQLTADTEHAVGAGEGVADQRLCRGNALVVVVVGLEVSGLEGHDVGHLVVEAQAEAEAVDDKRHVVHVSIGKLITGDLSTGRDGELLGDIPFRTCQILVGAAIEQFL